MCGKTTTVISRFFGTTESPICVSIDTESGKIDSDPAIALSTVVWGHNQSTLEVADHEHDKYKLTGWKNTECSPKQVKNVVQVS